MDDRFIGPEASTASIGYQAIPGEVMMIDPSKMSEADRRLNVESRILEVVTNFGGQQIVAGPAMERMVGLLRCAFDELAFEGWLPTVKEARS